MIKAVIFDCFGVLTTDGWKLIREEYFSHDATLMQRALDLDKAVNAGMMEYMDFIGQVADMSGLAKDETFARISRSNVPNTPLFEYIQDNLKSEYKIGMLSNAADDWLHELFDSQQVALFDQIVLSYQIGVTKPDPFMYESIATRLAVPADECVFIDDQQRYVDGAEHVGMKGIWFENTKKTIQTVEELIHA